MTDSMEIRTPGNLGTPGTSARPGKKAREIRPPPSEESLRLLRWIVTRSKRSSGLPLAEAFMRRASPSEPPPPLARMMRGGQGGEVRLKLYLTMSLLAVSPPYDIKPVPARAWAEMLALPDPERRGARRVNDALEWLAEHSFVVSERRQGTPGAVRLLSQAGTGDPYTRPAGAARYVRLPLGLWEQGWIARLSGAALGLLVILLDMQGGRARPSWISPTKARERYDLAPDTWTKGVRELMELDLVLVSKIPQGDVFDYRRMRNSYWANEEMLHFEATSGRRRTRPTSGTPAPVPPNP